MDITKESCRNFVTALASDAPTPGGGGAAALVGAIGTALGAMVASFTVGKPRYAEVQEEMLALQSKCTTLQTQLLDQVEADGTGFRPLADAYRIPKSDPDRPRKMEEALAAACAAPLAIMELSCESIRCLSVLAEKGSRLLVSDAGCGAAICRAALLAAALNVCSNTRMMTDRAAAAELDRKTDAMLNEYTALADAVFASVRADFS